jgi:hypothetical protein
MPRWAIDIDATTAGFEAAAKKMPKEIKKASDKSTRIMKASQDEIAKSTKNLVTDTAKVGKLAIPAFGELGEKIGGAIEGAAGLAGPYGLAAIAVAGVGLAAAGAVAGIVSMNEAAYEGIETFEAYDRAGFELVGEDKIARIESAHFALEGMSAATSALGAVVVAEFSPALERATVDLLALNLAGIDAFNTLVEGKGVVRYLGEGFVNLVSDALLPTVGKIRDITEAAADAARVLGKDELANQLDAVAGAFNIGGIAADAFEVGLEKLEHEGANYIARAEEMIETTRKLGKATTSTTSTTDEHAKALAEARRIGLESVEDLLSPRAKLNLAYEDTKARLLDIMDAHGDESEAGLAAADALVAANDQRLRAIDELAAKEAAEREKRILEAIAAEEEIYRSVEEAEAKKAALREAYREAEIASAAGLFGALADLSNTFAGESEKAQLRAFNFSKAANAVEAGMNTALAVSKASTSAPPPYNLIPMGLAAAQGAAQVAAILAAQPPQAYTGLDLPYAASTGTSVAVHPGERVLTRSEADDYRQGLHREAPARDNFVEGRDVARVWSRSVRRGSVATKELRARTGRLGQRSY